jgi:1,4-dihydroxy-2-naphthoyl-CoA hydrolase
LQDGALVGRKIVNPAHRRGAGYPVRYRARAVSLPDGAIPYENSFDALYGLELIETHAERASARVAVRDAVKQPMGLVHGGVYASIAESLTSVATAVAVYADGNFAVGMSNETKFLRPITQGTIHASAVRRHRGRTTWIWDVDFTDDDGRVCAVSRMTIAVRPR